MYLYRISFTAILLLASSLAPAQIPAVPPVPQPTPNQPAPAPQNHPTPPVHDPHTPGYVTATELPDGAVPPADKDGNFILGPTHTPAPESLTNPNIPHGDIFEFTLNSADSKFYPGIKRDPGPLGSVDPNDPAKLIVTTPS